MTLQFHTPYFTSMQSVYEHQISVGEKSTFPSNVTPKYSMMSSLTLNFPHEYVQLTLSLNDNTDTFGNFKPSFCWKINAELKFWKMLSLEWYLAGESLEWRNSGKLMWDRGLLGPARPLNWRKIRENFFLVI